MLRRRELFPDPRFVEGDIIAIGGALTTENLLEAYHKGIFPWFSENEPITWWSLNPRFVLFLPNFHISRSLKKSIRKNSFHLTLDTAFYRVIRACRTTNRPKQHGTWITEEMLRVYCELHEQGYAHSVEVWKEARLVGGLYGVAIGGCFCGESMFSLEKNASKMALCALSGLLMDANFGFIDCQQPTPHLANFGAEEIPRNNFLRLLQKELEKKTIAGSWSNTFPRFPESVLWNSLICRKVNIQ